MMAKFKQIEANMEPPFVIETKASSNGNGAEELSELPGLVCIAAHQPRLAARLSIVNPDGLPKGDGPGASRRVGAARAARLRAPGRPVLASDPGNDRHACGFGQAHGRQHGRG